MRNVTNLFKNIGVSIAFRVPIFYIITNVTRHHKTKLVVYVGRNVKRDHSYIGHNDRSLGFRYREHVRYIKTAQIRHMHCIFSTTIMHMEAWKKPLNC